MSESKESSVLFNLKELMNLEEDRVKTEEDERRRREEEERRRREEEIRRRREEEEARLRAEEEARVEAERLAREEEERVLRERREHEVRVQMEMEARARAEESAQAYQGIRSNFEVVDYVNIGFAAAGLLLAGGLLATIPGSITRPLESLIESADKMSLGDLGKKFEAGGVRDFERLAASLERMRVTMEAMIVRLKARSR